MSYGTSMSVSGGHGLGEASQSNVVDWSQILSSGIETVTSIYSAEQQQKQLERDRDFALKMAKINAANSIEQATDSSGKRTPDGLFGNISGKTVGIVAAVGAVVLGGFWFLGKKRR